MYAEHTVAKFAGSLQCPGEYFDLTLPALPVSRASIEANLANQPCLAYAIFQKINLLVALADKLRKTHNGFSRHSRCGQALGVVVTASTATRPIK